MREAEDVAELIKHQAAKLGSGVRVLIPVRANAHKQERLRGGCRLRICEAIDLVPAYRDSVSVAGPELHLLDGHEALLHAVGRLRCSVSGKADTEGQEQSRFTADQCSETRPGPRGEGSTVERRLATARAPHPPPNRWCSGVPARGLDRFDQAPCKRKAPGAMRRRDRMLDRAALLRDPSDR